MNQRKAAVVAAALAALLLAWRLLPAQDAAQPSATPRAAAADPAQRRPAPAPSAPAASAAVPLSTAGQQARQAQLALWQQRLARAEQVLESYRAATRYPYESRPVTEHPDQVRPFEPIAEDLALRTPGREPAKGVRIKTTQERVFASGQESVRFTVAAYDDDGKSLPLLVTRATAFDVPDPRQVTGRPQVAVAFNDSGLEPDVQGGDGVHSARLQPATQGFADYAGTIRVQVYLNQNGKLGNVYFDVVYSPQVPAEWAGVRETLNDGSLDFLLKARVAVAGRYVVSARVDDAQGRPFALLSFNDEVAAGEQEFRLRLFGKLVRDGEPAFPVRLRDVEGFLLLPDRFPDRAMMRRLAGTVHTSGSYALTAFSDAEWTSEERERYLAEYTRDTDEAREQVERLQR
jgi:hypothetical protein